MLKQQAQGKAGKADAGTDGALTGPTIAGCTADTGSLELLFNATLLGGEGLLLRPFDANETGGWYNNPYNDSADSYHPYHRAPALLPTEDSLGTMVCIADASVGGNASTCACQSWQYIGHNNSQNQLECFWYCEDGPGWKPPPKSAAAEMLRREGQEAAEAEGVLQGGIAVVANPFKVQWAPAPLRTAASGTSVMVDLTGPRLRGKTPLAVRLAWPLLGGASGVVADTCCPTRSIQDGHGICLPGNCPLYSTVSELPANPFFAVIDSGKCRCAAPQQCSE
jgi:hypothetical protein